jgi:hypothetical protein
VLYVPLCVAQYCVVPQLLLPAFTSAWAEALYTRPVFAVGAVEQHAAFAIEQLTLPLVLSL